MEQTVHSCLTCGEKVHGSSEDAQCQRCGRVALRPLPFDARELPLGVQLIRHARPEDEGARDPYRGLQRGEGIELLVPHRVRKIGAIKFAFLLLGAVAMLQGGLPIQARIPVAVIALATIVASTFPRTVLFRFALSHDRLVVGMDGVPAHRCINFKADELEGVFVRAQGKTDDSKDARFDLIAANSRGGLTVLLEGMKDRKMALWLAAGLEDSLGFEDE